MILSLFLLHIPIFIICEEDGSWKDLAFAVRTDENGTVESAHVYWTDEFDDSFAQAYTDQNRTGLDFLNDKPVPEVHIVPNFISEAFQSFMNFYKNQTKIAKVSINIPNLLDDIKKHLPKKPKSSEYPNVSYFAFNTFDTMVYSEFFKISNGIPDQIRLSFFNFAERTQKILDGRVLEALEFRKTKTLDLRAIETDVTDEQFLALECQSINIRSASLTNQGINRVVKEWQNGIRSTQYLKIVSDDIQKAEIMDGVMKTTLQRGTWQIRNRFNATAIVTISRIPTNFFEAQPTFEFSVN